MANLEEKLHHVAHGGSLEGDIASVGFGAFIYWPFRVKKAAETHRALPNRARNTLVT